MQVAILISASPHPGAFVQVMWCAMPQVILGLINMKRLPQNPGETKEKHVYYNYK